MESHQAALVSLIEKLAAVTKVDSDGKVSFVGWEATEYFDLLISALLPKCKICDTNKYRLTHKAILNAVQKEKFTLESIQAEINKAVRTYFDKQYNTYVIVTMVSVFPDCLNKYTTYAGKRINFCRKLPNKFQLARDRIVADACRTLKCNIPDDYSYLWLNVSARDVSDAIATGFKILDELRALWNFSHNYHGGRTYYSGPPKPVNKITFCPIHTVHDLNGKLSDDFWWYNPEYKNNITPFRDKKEFSKILIRTASISRRLIKTKLRDRILESLTRYSDALDSADCNVAILRLWAELECLTSTRFASYDMLIKRCSFVFIDREFAKLELNEIKKHRNMYAHEGSSNSTLQEHLMYSAKKYVEGLLHFLIINGHFFASMDEAGIFFDLPSDSSKLGRQIELLRKAKSYFD